MNPNLREDYKKTTDYTANFFHKHPDAVDKFYEKDINAIAKNTGLDRDIVDRDVQRTMKEIRLNTQDTLLEDTKRKGDIGGRATMQEGGSLLLDDREQYAQSEEPTHTMPDGTEMAGDTHGEYDEQMESLMDKETPMLPDEEMEEDYVDYVMDETLSDEDKNYLISTLEQDDRLSMIFDQVVESATEFSGEGPVDGPGTEKSDSIPARLSDGEFVFTAKATEEIGVDNLMSMMKDAESGADGRQELNLGGKPTREEETDVDQFGKPIDSNPVDDEIRKGMLSTNPRLK